MDQMTNRKLKAKAAKTNTARMERRLRIAAAARERLAAETFNALNAPALATR